MRRRRLGGLLLLLLVGALTNKRKADNKIRLNAAYQTLHGGDRSPYLGHALTLCCVSSFEAEAAASPCLSVLLCFYSKPGQVAG